MNNPLRTLAFGLDEFRSSDRFCDTTLVCSNNYQVETETVTVLDQRAVDDLFARNPQNVAHKAHRAVLEAACDAFGGEEAKDAKAFYLGGCRPSVVELCLKYVYGQGENDLKSGMDLGVTCKEEILQVFRVMKVKAIPAFFSDRPVSNRFLAVFELSRGVHIGHLESNRGFFSDKIQQEGEFPVKSYSLSNELNEPDSRTSVLSPEVEFHNVFEFFDKSRRKDSLSSPPASGDSPTERVVTRSAAKSASKISHVAKGALSKSVEEDETARKTSELLTVKDIIFRCSNQFPKEYKLLDSEVTFKKCNGSFLCVFCKPKRGPNISRRDTFYRHVKNAHKLVVPGSTYVCMFCPRHFVVRSCFAAHLRSHHANHVRQDVDDDDDRGDADPVEVDGSVDETPQLPCDSADSEGEVEADLQRSVDEDVSDQTLDGTEDFELYQDSFDPEKTLDDDDVSTSESSFVAPVQETETKNAPAVESVKTSCPTVAGPFHGQEWNPSNTEKNTTVRIVNLSERYKCDSCEKVFETKGKLTRHRKLVHGSNHQFPCPYCVKGFSNKTALAIHVRVHTRSKPYQCTICGHRAAVQANCRQHIRNRHPNSPTDEPAKLPDDPFPERLRELFSIPKGYTLTLPVELEFGNISTYAAKKEATRFRNSILKPRSTLSPKQMPSSQTSLDLKEDENVIRSLSEAAPGSATLSPSEIIKEKEVNSQNDSALKSDELNISAKNIEEPTSDNRNHCVTSVAPSPSNPSLPKPIQTPQFLATGPTRFPESQSYFANQGSFYGPLRMQQMLMQQQNIRMLQQQQYRMQLFQRQRLMQQQQQQLAYCHFAQNTTMKDFGDKPSKGPPPPIIIKPQGSTSNMGIRPSSSVSVATMNNVFPGTIGVAQPATCSPVRSAMSIMPKVASSIGASPLCSQGFRFRPSFPTQGPPHRPQLMKPGNVGPTRIPFPFNG